MFKYIFRAMVCCLLILRGFHTHAQNLDSLLDLNAFTEESELQKILNKNVSVTSQNALTTRETPGIISLITAEEIQNSGARDLIDILRLVPGFEVMQDLQFVMGLGLRGNWANEGKVLVMMDGQPFNELLYQTVAVGNRFPVDAIEQIEIIRGPGSAIYGGSAEYGVINIKTKAAESLNGAALYGIGGFHANASGRTNGGLMIAKKSQRISWDASIFKGRGIVSDEKNYQDLYQEDDLRDLRNASYADPMNINVGLRVNRFRFRAMYDEFKTRDPLTFISYKDLSAEVQYQFRVTNKFTVTPKLQYLNQIPWAYGDIATGEYGTNARAQRYYGEINGNYNLNRRSNLNFGVVYFKDQANDRLPDHIYFLNKGEISFNNIALFAQGLFKHRLANATIGFRYERNNQYGDAFVPRLALTKKIENFHFKILYSQAFRAPAIENINLAVGGEGNIKPEKSNAFEVELGYQFTSQMLLAINAFNLLTRNVIVYGSEVEEGTYQNYSKSGSRGIEIVYSIRKKNWYANLTYSYSRAISGNGVVPTYLVPQTNNLYVGFPSQKVTLNTNFYFTTKLSFNPTFIYSSKRYAFTSIDENEDPVSNEMDPYLLANMFLNYRNIIPGLTAGAGVYDLFNQKPSIPQAYDGGYAPIPFRSREYVIKLAYQINFKN